MIKKNKNILKHIKICKQLLEGAVINDLVQISPLINVYPYTKYTWIIKSKVFDFLTANNNNIKNEIFQWWDETEKEIKNEIKDLKKQLKNLEKGKNKLKNYI